MKPGKHGFARIIAAAQYSRDGLAAAYRNEAAFRQLVWLHAVLLPLASCTRSLKSPKMPAPPRNWWRCCSLAFFG